MTFDQIITSQIDTFLWRSKLTLLHATCIFYLFLQRTVTKMSFCWELSVDELPHEVKIGRQALYQTSHLRFSPHTNPISRIIKPEFYSEWSSISSEIRCSGIVACMHNSSCYIHIRLILYSQHYHTTRDNLMIIIVPTFKPYCNKLLLGCIYIPFVHSI